MSDSSEGEGQQMPQRDPREHQGAIPKRPVKVEATSKSERPKRLAAIKAMSKLTTTNTERSTIKGSVSDESCQPKKDKTQGVKEREQQTPKKLRAGSASPTPSRRTHSNLDFSTPVESATLSDCDDAFDCSLRRGRKAEALLMKTKSNKAALKISEECAKKLSKVDKVEGKLHDSEVRRILKKAEKELELPPYHVIYEDLVRWNPDDADAPWIVNEVLFETTKPITGRRDQTRKVQRVQYWLAHSCKLSEGLKEICQIKNPNVPCKKIIFTPRVPAVAEEDSEEDSSSETDMFFADFDPNYENLEPIIRIQGSERATSGPELKFNLRKTNKENQAGNVAGSSSTEMGSKLLPGLPPPTRGKKKQGQGLLPFAADGQFSDMHDPTLPDRLLRKAVEIRKNQGAAEEQTNTEGPGSTNQAASSSSSAQGQLSKETTNNPAVGAAKKERMETRKPIEANKMKGSGARTKHGDDYWRPGNSLTRSLPNDVVNVEDLFGFIVLILRMCWSNSIFHMFLDMLGFGRDRLATTAFLKKSSKLSMSEMKEFLRDASRPGRSSFLTNKQASIWATICRKIVQAVVPPGEISIVGNLFSYTGIPSITPCLVLRILKFQTILREYIYADHNKICKHLNKLYQGDVGVPFVDFQRTVTTGELPVRNLDYPCPKCKSPIKMRIHYNKEGFFVLAEGYGEAINRGNIYTKFPKNVVIQNIRYELRAVLAYYVSRFKDVANAVVLIPEIIDEHFWDVVDDGTHVKGKADAKTFTAAAMLATYVFKEEV